MASNAYQLEGFIRILESWGLSDVLLPFILVFAVFFAVLQKTDIVGEGKKNINGVIALVFALMFVIPHVTGNYSTLGFDPVNILNAALPSVGIVAIAIIFLLVLLGLFAHEKVFLGVTAPGWIAFVSFIIILVIFGGAAGWWQSGFGYWLENTFGSDAMAILIMILVFGLVIAWITTDSKGAESSASAERLGFHFNRLFGDGKG